MSVSVDSRADNAQPPTRQPCNIKPSSVSPKESAAEDAATPSEESVRGSAETAEGTEKMPPSQDAALPQKQKVIQKSAKLPNGLKNE